MIRQKPIVILLYPWISSQVLWNILSRVVVHDRKWNAKSHHPTKQVHDALIQQSLYLTCMTLYHHYK
jgi:hypothetical protein